MLTLPKPLQRTMFDGNPKFTVSNRLKKLRAEIQVPEICFSAVSKRSVFDQRKIEIVKIGTRMQQQTVVAFA